jgi:hypothetical protein
MSGQRHHEQAETVRAYLVGLRGGAFFLSSSDARLLQRWIEDQVPVWLILEGLDKAAEKRRAKRQRTPLSLQHAKAHVKKGLVRSEHRVNALPGLAEELAAKADPELSRLAETLKTATPEAGVAAMTAFHETRWEDADQAPWLARAEAELDALKSVLSPDRFRELVHETARDLMRQSTPELCASRAWDTVPS